MYQSSLYSRITSNTPNTGEQDKDNNYTSNRNYNYNTTDYGSNNYNYLRAQRPAQSSTSQYTNSNLVSQIQGQNQSGMNQGKVQADSSYTYTSSNAYSSGYSSNSSTKMQQNNYNNYNNSLNRGNIEDSDSSYVSVGQANNEAFEINKEYETLIKKNEFYLKYGLLFEWRIWYESLTLRIQMNFRRYIRWKKLGALLENRIKIKKGIKKLENIFTNQKRNVFNTIKKCNKSNNINKKVNAPKHNFRGRPPEDKHNTPNKIMKNQLNVIKNHFKNTEIDTNNHIALNFINLPKKENKNNLIITQKQRKYILKYLLLKKIANLKNILKMAFEKYKKKALVRPKIEKKEEKEEVKKEEKKEEKGQSGENIEALKIKKLRKIINKKIYKNKEKLHIAFIKYYYSCLYVHLHWYMYVVNQLSAYTQGQTAPQTTATPLARTNTASATTIQPKSDDTDSEMQNSAVYKAFTKNLRAVNKINVNKNKEDEALKESIMNINRINEALATEKQKTERQKHLKDLVTKRIKQRQNELHQLFTKFFYQGKLWEKTLENKQVNIEGTSNDDKLEIKEGTTKLRGKRDPAKDRRNRGRNLRKLMAKKEKDRIEEMRKFFYKFHTNGMLFFLKKNSKRTEAVIEAPSKTEEEKEEIKEEPKELTYLDKKLLEAQKEKEELLQKRVAALKNIFYKTDRQYIIIKKNVLEKWNLRAKLLSLPKTDSLKKSVRKKKLKKSTRKKETSKIALEKLEIKESSKSVLEKLESMESSKSVLEKLESK